MTNEQRWSKLEELGRSGLLRPEHCFPDGISTPFWNSKDRVSDNANSCWKAAADKWCIWVPRVCGFGFKHEVLRVFDSYVEALDAMCEEQEQIREAAAEKVKG